MYNNGTGLRGIWIVDVWWCRTAWFFLVDFLLHKAVFQCGRRYFCSKYLLIITLRCINKCH